ncbi:hypothetical protein AVEN_94647-1, partial [Araneus ventricosus]
MQSIILYNSLYTLKYYSEAVGWAEQVFGTDFTHENTVENWVIYRNVDCKNSEAEKDRHFDEFGQLAGEYWM